MLSYLLSQAWSQSLDPAGAGLDHRLRGSPPGARAGRSRSSRSVPGMSQADIARIADADGARPAAAGPVLGVVHPAARGDWGSSYRDSQPVLDRDRLAPASRRSS